MDTQNIDDKLIQHFYIQHQLYERLDITQDNNTLTTYRTQTNTNIHIREYTTQYKINKKNK